MTQNSKILVRGEVSLAARTIWVTKVIDRSSNQGGMPL